MLEKKDQNQGFPQFSKSSSNTWFHDQAPLVGAQRYSWVLACVCVCRRVTHFAFFHWQSLVTFTQGGSRRFKHLQAGVGLNQCPRCKQYNKRCLSNSHLFFKKSNCTLSISMLRLSPLSGSRHYVCASPVLRLDSILSCPI